MTVSLKDVALAAGVSRSTASRALSGSELISEETRVRVHEAATQLNYRVNRTASALRSRRSLLIGLILNNLVNATFHTVAEVVQRRAYEHGYQVILCITDNDPDREAAFISMLSEHGVDGIIATGSGQNAELANSLLDQGLAMVNLIRAVPGSMSPTVLADDISGSLAATRYLLGLGHRRIGYIGAPLSTTSGQERLAGYHVGLAEAQVTAASELLLCGPFDQGFGAAAVRQLLELEEPPTALLVANHEAISGVLPALTSMQIRIPEQLSLVCYEDIDWLSGWQPPVTVVDNGAQHLGELAWELLFQQLTQHNASLGSAVEVRGLSRLIERESCRKI